MYRLIRNPVLLPLLYIAVAISIPLVLSGGAKITNTLDDELGNGGTLTLVILGLISPIIALVSWQLQKGRGWRRFWGNYLRLVADILLGSGIAALFYLQATHQTNVIGYQLTAVFITGAVAVYAIWVIAADILHVIEDTPRVRAEVGRR